MAARDHSLLTGAERQVLFGVSDYPDDRARCFGKEPNPSLLAHISPIGWEHITFGDFPWGHAALRSGRKPLSLGRHHNAA